MLQINLLPGLPSASATLITRARHDNGVDHLVECFYPGSSFPSLSVTGASCALDCRHCSRRYLSGMVPVTTPDDLLSIAEALARRGAKGFLLSGGLDRDGRVPLSDHLEAIREIKSSTDLMVNAHIGLARKGDIAALVDAGVDAFSVDVYGSDSTISEVLGLSARVEDYLEVVGWLKDAGAPNITPHLCVGIHGGRIKGEMAAIERLRALEPEQMVIISLIPTKGTAYEGIPAPGKAEVLSVVRAARSSHPDARLLLGCMRSKKDRSWETEAVEAGLDGIVLPSERTVVELAEKGYAIRKRSVCCAIR